jgi:hypothetical protein
MRGGPLLDRLAQFGVTVPRAVEHAVHQLLYFLSVALWFRFFSIHVNHLQLNTAYNL